MVNRIFLFLVEKLVFTTDEKIKYKPTGLASVGFSWRPVGAKKICASAGNIRKSRGFCPIFAKLTEFVDAIPI